MTVVPGPPVILVHGWAGSFATTWQQTPLVPLLEDIGREVVGVDLLGHGAADKPHDPGVYADLTPAVTAVLPDEPVDAVGFSLGALVLLAVAREQPQRFRRLVLAGIGENVFRDDPQRTAQIVAAVEGQEVPDDPGTRIFHQYATAAGNDPLALAALLRCERAPLTPEDLATATCETLVVIGDRDPAGPGDRLAAALPDATSVTLRNVDHFATVEAFPFIDAVLDFLA